MPAVAGAVVQTGSTNSNVVPFCCTDLQCNSPPYFSLRGEETQENLDLLDAQRLLPNETKAFKNAIKVREGLHSTVVMDTMSAGQKSHFELTLEEFRPRKVILLWYRLDPATMQFSHSYKWAEPQATKEKS